MGRLTAFLLGRFRAWERPSQVGIILALGLLLAALLAAALGPEAVRVPALAGAFGLLVVAQVIFMWANRTMVTPYTRAQRLYLAEDFEAARQILEALDAAGKADMQALTLLGNTYRQLGRLDESSEVLTKALRLRPSDPFPLYGFGRTLLVMGLYVEAEQAFRQALAEGAPPLAHADLGETLYRIGRRDEAREVLRAAAADDESPQRALLAAYLLYSLGGGQSPARELVEAGLPYWRAAAERFSRTPYGQDLMHDVARMQALIEEA